MKENSTKKAKKKDPNARYTKAGGTEDGVRNQEGKHKYRK